MVPLVRHEAPRASVIEPEARLLAGLVEFDEEIHWSGLGDVVLYSRRSPEKSTSNEDAALAVRLTEERGVVAVADGVGGQPAGERASAEALAALQRALEESVRSGESLSAAVLRGIDRANDAVMALGTGSATTLAVITVEGTNVRAYHVGDSGVLGFGGRGKVKLETIAHSPVGYGVEAGLIATSEAMQHKERHFVSNVVGEEDMHIGVSSSLTLRPRDRVLLASDGLFDNATVDDIVAAVRKGAPQEGVRTLGAACNARMLNGGHADDMTIAVYRCAAPER